MLLVIFILFFPPIQFESGVFCNDLTRQLNSHTMRWSYLVNMLTLTQYTITQYRETFDRLSKLLLLHFLLITALRATFYTFPLLKPIFVSFL